MATKIVVTQDDIYDGERGDPWFCPIALACERVFPDLRVGIGTDNAYIGQDQYSLPIEAQNFIASFDGNSAVEPFEFELGDPRVEEDNSDGN